MRGQPDGCPLFLLFGVLGGSLKKQTALGDVTSDKCVSCKLSKGLPEKGMTGCRDCLQKADRSARDPKCVKIKHN